MELYKIVSAAIASAALFGSGGDQRPPVREELLIAAAASLSVAAPQLARAFRDTSGVNVRFNFAGSNTLARQIIEGAQVDAFISADERQLDAVEEAGRVVAGTRVNVVSNQLVLIANASSSGHGPRVEDLASARVRRVAMGDPAAVPAGVYGRQWLEAVEMWPHVSPKIVPLPASPAVLAAVAAGRADVGIVYLSDVSQRRSVGDVKIIHRVSRDEGPAILYPAAAIVGGRTAPARQFLAFLGSDRAQAIFAAAGFLPLNSR